jgi:hypothetical protein
MKKILSSHPNTVITVLVLVFLVVPIALYAWVINGIVLDAQQALSSAPAGSGTGFDITGASNLDLRGLVTVVVPTPIATTTPIAATTTTSVGTSTTSTPAGSTSSTRR